MASRRSTALITAVVGLVAVGLGLSVAAQSSPESSGMSPGAGARPLTADQRRARAQFWAQRRGLQFGVPQGAYRAAVDRMRRLEPLGPSAGAAAPPPLSVGPTWEFIGPEPMNGALPNFGGTIPGSTFNATGRVTAIAADPTMPGRIFVGAAGGGVWMTTDGGATFTSIGDALPTQAIGAIALDPVNTQPPTIYVATGEAHNGGDSFYGRGVFKSTNLGATWIELAPGTFDRVAISKLAVDVSKSPATLFAAAGLGVSGGRAGQAFLESDPTKVGLWRSADGGNTWTFIGSASACGQNLPASDVLIDPLNPSRVYVSIQACDVFVSADGGNSFSAIGLAFACALLGCQIDRISLAVGPPASGAPLACSNGTRACGAAYAMIGSGDASHSYLDLIESTDGGSHWVDKIVPCASFPSNGSTIDGTMDGTGSSCGSPSSFSQEFYDQALLVSPTNASTVFLGSVGLYESTDSGSTWSFLPLNGGTHSDQHALAIAPDNDTVYVGNDGGLFKFSIRGISGGAATFVSLNGMLPVSQIQAIGPHPTNNSVLLAGFQDNGTNLFSGALNWSQVETGDGGFTLFDRVSPSVAYHTFAAGGTKVTLGFSSNGGLQWSDVCGSFAGRDGMDPGFAFYPPLAADPSVAERVLLGGHHVYVLSSASFQASNSCSPSGQLPVTLQSSQDLNDGCPDGRCALEDLEFFPGNHAIAWAVAMEGAIRGGGAPFKVWNTRQADCPDRPSCTSTAQGKLGTWTDVTLNLGVDPTKTQATGIALDPGNQNDAYVSLSGFTAATGQGHVYRTSDFGAHWIRADGAGGASPLPDIPVLRLLVDANDGSGNTVYAATDIGVFRSTNGGATWSAFNLGVIPAVPVFDIEQNNNGTIFVGTHGRGAYRLATATSTSSTSTSSTTSTSRPPTTTTSSSTTTTMPPPCLLDVDGNGRVEVSTDVVYIARYLLGLAPVPPSFRVLDPTIPQDATIAARIETARPSLDVDMNGRVEVSTDVVYIARHLLGLTPVPPSFRVLDPTIPPDATIAAKIDALCP